jgi:hypothetical protein
MGKLLLLVALAAAVLLLLRGSRQRRGRRGADGLRAHFARVARLRLIAACPRLDGVLTEADLKLLFDWIFAELCRRTGTAGLRELVGWSLAQGQGRSAELNADVTRAAVDRLPQPALAEIDSCDGRTVAGVLLDEALTEAGHRYAPQLRRALG